MRFPALALLLTLLALSAAACGPVDSAAYAQGWGTVTPTPNDPVGTARVAEAMAQAAANSTAEAHRELAEKATLQAAQTGDASAAEIAAINAQIEGTQQAVAVQQTLTADEMRRSYATQDAQATSAVGTQQAAATQTAYPAAVWATRDSFSRTATPDKATQMAVERAVRIALQEEQNARDAAFGWLVIKGMIAGAAVLIVYRLLDLLITWAKTKVLINASLRESRGGLVRAWIDKDGIIRAEGVVFPKILDVNPPPRSYTDLNALDAVQMLSPSVYASPMPHSEANGVTELAKQLIQDAVNVAGPEADRVPRWDKLAGWTSEKIQRVVAALVAVGALETKSGVGTFVTDRFGNLDNLAYALETGQLKVRPVPLPRESVSAGD